MPLFPNGDAVPLENVVGLALIPVRPLASAVFPVPLAVQPVSVPPLPLVYPGKVVYVPVSKLGLTISAAKTGAVAQPNMTTDLAIFRIIGFLPTPEVISRG